MAQRRGASAGETSSRGTRKDAYLGVRLPAWLKDAIMGAARALGVKPSDVVRAILSEPLVVDDGIPATMAMVAAYMAALEAINRRRAERLQTRCEAVEEPIPEGAIEVVGLRRKQG